MNLYHRRKKEKKRKKKLAELVEAVAHAYSGRWPTTVARREERRRRLRVLLLVQHLAPVGAEDGRLRSDDAGARAVRQRDGDLAVGAEDGRLI